MTFGLLTGCGSTKTDSTDKTATETKTEETAEVSTDAAATEETAAAGELTVWAWDESFNIPAVNDAVAIYNQENPDVKINVVTMSQDDIVAKLNTSLASGTYDGLPDVVLIEDYKIQGYLNSYPDEFADLSSVVNKDDFATYKTGVNMIGDAIYGVPFDSGVAALFYRLDLIEQAGYTEADMQDMTWEKYIEVGKAVKEKTGVDWLTLDPSDVGQIRMMIQSAGSWYTDADGKVTIANNAALASSINVYKQLMEAGFVKQTSDWDQFVGAFNNGDVASVFTGCWITNSVKKAADQSGNWRVASLPRLSDIDTSVNASSIGGAGWYVLKNVGNEALAADFLGKTFGSSKDLMYQLGDEISLVSTLTAAADYSKQDEFFGGQDIAASFSKWTATVPSVNYGENTYAIEDIMTEAVQAIVGGADLTSTLEDYQAQVEAAVQQ